MNQEKLIKFAPTTIRIGIALVFLWFGIEQLIDAKSWTGWLPSYIGIIPLEPITIVQLNGLFETFFGILLLIGVYTRFSAILLSLHMVHILSVVGYGEIGVRDFGILAGSMSVALHGPDFLTLDRFISKKEKIIST